MLGPKLAIVLRAQNGENFLVQTHGIPGKVVQESSKDALQTLGRFSKDGAKAGLIDGSGDATPDFALGMIPVLQGRYLVTYRLVNAILLFVISEASTNAFLCLRTLDAATKILVGACKGIDVTSSRLSKQYAEVHSSLGDVISGGVAALPPSFMHTSATDERLLAVPLSAADAARRLRKFMATGGKSSTFAPKQSDADATDPSAQPPGSNSSMPQVPETPTVNDANNNAFRRKSAENADPLARIEFSIPSDALPPPPARAVGAKRRPPAPPRVLVQTTVPSAFRGAVEDGTENQPPVEAEGFGAFEEVKLMEATPADATQPTTDEWTADFQQQQSDKQQQATGPSLHDLRQALQLVETWHAEVNAGKLIKAGLQGEVRRRLAPYGLTAARFRVAPSSTLVVNACLQTAVRNKAHSYPVVIAAQNNNSNSGDQVAAVIEEEQTTTPNDSNNSKNTINNSTTTIDDDDEFAYHAVLSGVPMDTSYLRYDLPSVACDPPLQVDLLVAPPSQMHVPGKPARTQWEGMIILRYTANPMLHGPLIDVIVDVDFAPDIPTLKKISPAGKWSKEQCRIRWSLGVIKPGESGCCRAIVQAREGTTPARAEECLKGDTKARVVFTVWPGRSISGVGFEVAMPQAKKGDGYHAGRTVSFGEILVNV